MKCKHCGNNVQDNWKICPFCGSPIEKKKHCLKCGAELQPSWVICPFCGEDASASIEPLTPTFGKTDILPNVDGGLFADGGLDLVAGDILEAKQNQQSQQNAEYNEKLKLARIACVRKNYEQANSIYEELLAKNPEDMNAYIGLIRIATQNYSEYIGEDIDLSIEIAQEIAEKDISLLDRELAEYLKNRKINLKKFEEEKIRKEEADRKAKEEADRKLLEELEREEAEEKARIKEEAVRCQLQAQEEAKRKAQERIEEIYKEAKDFFNNRKLRECIECLEKILKEDFNDANLLMGLCYNRARINGERLFGNYVNSEYTEVRWFKKAFNNGSKEACFHLGRVYASIKSYELAIEWYEKAAEYGVEDAYVNLARLYELELKDLESAKKWYKKSGEAGNIQSKLNYNRLEQLTNNI